MSELTRAAKNYRNAQAGLELARASFHAAIADELRNGATQAELVRFTGYSREQLRRIARQAGIASARA